MHIVGGLVQQFLKMSGQWLVKAVAAIIIETIIKVKKYTRVFFIEAPLLIQFYKTTKSFKHFIYMGYINFITRIFQREYD